MHHWWCEFLGEDLDGRCWDLGTWGPQEQLEKLVVGGWTLEMILMQGFANLPSQNVPKTSKFYCECFGCSNKKRTFSEMLFGSNGAPAKGLKRPGENPLTSHLHPQN